MNSASDIAAIAGYTTKRIHTVNSKGIVSTVSRKEDLAKANPQRYTVVRRAAESLSRRNVDQAVCELLNEALSRLTALCYEHDGEGLLCNVDPATGRVLVPLPWGKAGYRKWGLTPTEANTMRRIMLTRQRRGLPLFFFDRSRRSWYLNLHDFSDGKLVLAQLKEWEIGVGEYRAACIKMAERRVGKR
jgi:hypothetical protein